MTQNKATENTNEDEDTAFQVYIIQIHITM